MKVSPYTGHDRGSISDIQKVENVCTVNDTLPCISESSYTTPVVQGEQNLPEMVDTRVSSTVPEVPPTVPTSPPIGARPTAQSPISNRLRSGVSARIENVTERDTYRLGSDGGPRARSSSTAQSSLQDGECHRYLQQLCPACFGGAQFGRPLE
jgi:hypothetical protein